MLFEQSERERISISDVLRHALPDNDVRVAGTFDKTLELLKLGSADLFIASVPHFSFAYTSFLSRVQAHLPGSPILVISTATNAEVSSNVWRLGVTDYLLKPFRPEWLAAAVRTLLTSSEVSQSSKMDWRRDMFGKRFGEYLQEYKYRKCIETTREYVDSLYDALDSSTEISAAMVGFAECAVSFASGFGPTCLSDAESYLVYLRVKLECVSRKYDAYVLFEQLVGKLFDLAERAGLSGTSGIQRVLTHIDRCVREELTLVSVAKYANMSPSYFSKCFKRETGCNFVSYVIDGKMEYARLMLLESDMSIVQIANELSYNGANYFSKSFKKKMGLTPSEYRERQGIDLTR